MTVINKLFFTVNITLAIYLLILFQSPVTSIEESFCAGLGYINNSKTWQPRGVRTMGASSVFAHPTSTFWGANHMYSGFNIPDTVDLVIQSLEYNYFHGVKELNGWLHLNLRRSDKNYHFNALAIWAVTNKRETVGEFVYLGANGCKSSNWAEAQHFLPCSAVPIDAPLPTNMFVYTNPNTNVKLSELNLLWRANWNYCDKPESFQFIFAISPNVWNSNPQKQFRLELGQQKYGPIVYLSSPIIPKYHGAASPILDKSKISCSKDVLKTRPHWFKSIPKIEQRGILTNVSLEDAFFEPRWEPNTGQEEIQNVMKRQVCKVQLTGFVGFGGRCLGKVKDPAWNNRRVTGTLQQPPICPHPNTNLDQSDVNKFVGPFTIFLETKRKTNLLKNCLCPAVPTSNDVATEANASSFRTASEKYVKNPVDKAGCKSYRTADYSKHGLCLESFAGREASGSRQWHTIAMLCTTMVLVPVNGFVARYMKGPLPVGHYDRKPRIPVRAWYISHILFILPISCIYITSLSTIHRQKATIGFSHNVFATVHRGLGWTLIVVFILQCCLGVLRPLSIKLRKISIFFHWLGGVILHYGGTILVILSYRIPAAPTSFHNLLDDEYFPHLQHNIASMILVVYVVVDLGFHVFLTRYLVRYDRTRLEITVRPFFPVLLPIRMDNDFLRTYSIDDLEDEPKHVKKFFFAYLIACVIMFVFMLFLILFYRSRADLGFGPMSVTSPG